MIQNGEQSGGIDTYQPVGPLTASSSGEEVIILSAALQLTETLGDGLVLHRGNPQSEDGLLTASHLVDIAEDQLTLASGIAGVDNIRNIGPVHQLFQHIELLILVTGNLILPVGGNDGKIVIAPLGVFLIVGVCIGQLSQMAEAPGHDIVAALHISVLTVLYAQDGGNGHAHRGLLSNYQSFCHQ